MEHFFFVLGVLAASTIMVMIAVGAIWFLTVWWPDFQGRRNQRHKKIEAMWKVMEEEGKIPLGWWRDDT